MYRVFGRSPGDLPAGAGRLAGGRDFGELEFGLHGV
jgi:hypothetical protein